MPSAFKTVFPDANELRRRARVNREVRLLRDLKLRLAQPPKRKADIRRKPVKDLGLFVGK